MLRTCPFSWLWGIFYFLKLSLILQDKNVFMFLGFMFKRNSVEVVRILVQIWQQQTLLACLCTCIWPSSDLVIRALSLGAGLGYTWDTVGKVESFKLGWAEKFDFLRRRSVWRLERRSQMSELSFRKINQAVMCRVVWRGKETAGGASQSQTRQRWRPGAAGVECKGWERGRIKLSGSLVGRVYLSLLEEGGEATISPFGKVRPVKIAGAWVLRALQCLGC